VSTESFVKAERSLCGGKIEFDSSEIEQGQSVSITCPHCGKEISVSALPPETTENPRDAAATRRRGRLRYGLGAGD